MKVKEDFRYVGAHISTVNVRRAGTLDDRVSKGVEQLSKLAKVQATPERKAGIVSVKIYQGALYGVEVADCKGMVAN